MSTEASPRQSQSAAREQFSKLSSLYASFCPAGTLKFVAFFTVTIVLTSGTALATTAPDESVHVQFAGSFTFVRSPAPVQRAVMPRGNAAEQAVVNFIVSITVADAS